MAVSSSLLFLCSSDSEPALFGQADFLFVVIPVYRCCIYTCRHVYDSTKEVCLTKQSRLAVRWAKQQYIYILLFQTHAFTCTQFGLWVWALAWYHTLHFKFRSIWAWAWNSLRQPQTQHVSQPSACLHVCHQRVLNRACESACELASASYSKGMAGTSQHDVSGPAIATNNVAHIQSLAIVLQRACFRPTITTITSTTKTITTIIINNNNNNQS